VDAEHAGGRRAGRRWAWRSVGLLLTFLVVLYLGGPLLARAEGAGRLLSRLDPLTLTVAVLLEAGALASYSRLTLTVLPGFRPSYGTVLRIDLSAFGLSHTVPAGDAAGAALGFRLLTVAGVPAPQVLSAAAIQTTAQVGVLAVLFSGSVLITLPRTQHSQLYVGAGLVVAVLLGAATVLLIWLSRNVDAARVWTRHVVGRLPPFSQGFVEATLHSLVTGVEALRTDRRLLLRTTAWAGANWLLDAASLWVFVAAFGHRLNVDELLVAYGLANLIGALPVTPGGLGVIEGFLIPALVGLGAPAATATLGVLAWRAASFWLPIPVAGLCFLSLRMGPWALRDRPRPEPEPDPA
jgi:uncharacterized protein (TIRG00374 family)